MAGRFAKKFARMMRELTGDEPGVGPVAPGTAEPLVGPGLWTPVEPPRAGRRRDAWRRWARTYTGSEASQDLAAGGTIAHLPPDQLDLVVSTALGLALHRGPSYVELIALFADLNEIAAGSERLNVTLWADPERALRASALVANRLADADGEPTVLRRWLSWAQKQAHAETDVFADALADLDAGRAELDLPSERSDIGEIGLQRALVGADPDMDLETFVARLAGLRRQIGRVRAGGSSGTAFLVGPRHVLTNRHVLGFALNDRDELIDEVQVSFDIGPGGEEGSIRRAIRCLASRPAGAEEREGVRPGAHALDYALLELDAAAGEDPLPGGPRGWVRLPWDLPPTVRAGQILAICQLPGAASTRLALGALVARDPIRMRYRINTESGSSGSPVFTLEWELAALHHAGEAAYNRGIPIGPILEDLRERCRDALTQPPELLAQAQVQSPEPPDFALHPHAQAASPAGLVMGQQQMQAVAPAGLVMGQQQMQAVAPAGLVMGQQQIQEMSSPEASEVGLDRFELYNLLKEQPIDRLSRIAERVRVPTGPLPDTADARTRLAELLVETIDVDRLELEMRRQKVL